MNPQGPHLPEVNLIEQSTATARETGAVAAPPIVPHTGTDFSRAMEAHLRGQENQPAIASPASQTVTQSPSQPSPEIGPMDVADLPYQERTKPATFHEELEYLRKEFPHTAELLERTWNHMQRFG